jgi:D-alanine-D-alanine ligase-like ATP-grasp enzyme
MTTQKYELYENILKKYPEEAHGPALMMYTIPLEAWQRGIEVRFVTTYVKGQLKVRYVLSHNGTSHRFQLSLGDKVSKEARRIGKSKELTKNYLEDAGVSVPKGKVISIKNQDYNDALKFAELLEYPVIVKPAHASLAIGVCTNIRGNEALISALDYVHGELGYEEIIIERHANGFDTRTFVVGDQVVGAFKRVPANVIGDNKNTIEELIHIKNQYRKNNPHLSGSLIEIDTQLINYISEQGYSLDDILEKGVKIDLSQSTFAKDYSETVDITDEITANYKATAINAVKYLPGMNLAGVDIIMDQETDQNYVLEVNCRPNIGGHLFPVVGKRRDVPKAIIDYYFPETKGIDKGKRVYFTFDYDSIISFLRKGIVKEVILPPLPKKGVTNVYIKLTGDFERHKKWIFKAAVGQRLGGGIIEQDDTGAKMVIAGSGKRVERFMEKVGETLSSINLEVTDEDKWESLITYKFELPDDLKGASFSESEKQYDSENIKLKKENDKLKKELKQLKQSNSWKVTKPLRAISGLRKKKEQK